MIDSDLLHETLTNARNALLAERNAAGHWTGELSTSALSTATALVALGTVDESAHRERIAAACRWLVEHQNEDGGWGDTVKSFSNLSTTLLAWSALRRFGGAESDGAAGRASHWVHDYVGSLDPALIAETVKARYGKDRTFSVPILMLCALCGTLGPRGWKFVLQLPFQLAAFPRNWFAILRLPVVSYALPALIAIGYARHRQGPSLTKQPHFLWPRLSKLLASIQPASGGFLEAAPLTSFVTMALVSAGEREHLVVRNGVRFLLETVRPDGSWPIDTNLATWATTLAVKALTVTQEGQAADPTLFDGHGKVKRWLLDQQYRERHPFTDAAPGGWAWTDLSGGVPDADDTPGALLALKTFPPDDETLVAAQAGVVWLLDLQNRDGGIPTFCRGWGALPFDRSSPDLTAHALRAWAAWREAMPVEIQGRLDRASDRALAFLLRQQRPDGSWRPLWFGNQHRRDDEENPTYGTAQVLLALAPVASAREAVARGVAWLLANQNPDGGWGASKDTTPSTIEETALALGALSYEIQESSGRLWIGYGITSESRDLTKVGRGVPAEPSSVGKRPSRLPRRGSAAAHRDGSPHPAAAGWLDRQHLAPRPETIQSSKATFDPVSAIDSRSDALSRGLAWLAAATERGTRFEASPVGFYFAKLWYFEKAYPLVWTVEALSRLSLIAESAEAECAPNRLPKA